MFEQTERYEIVTVHGSNIFDPGGIQSIEIFQGDKVGLYGRLCELSAATPGEEFCWCEDLGAGFSQPRGTWRGGQREVGWWQDGRGWTGGPARFRAVTPHDVVLELPSGARRVIATEGSARVVEECAAMDVGGLPAVRKTYTRVEGLPSPDPGVYFIASLLVCQALPWRVDLCCPDTGPGSVVRDEAGIIVAVRRLQVVHAGGTILPVRAEHLAADLRTLKGRLKASYYPVTGRVDFVGSIDDLLEVRKAVHQDVALLQERPEGPGFVIIPEQAAAGEGPALLGWLEGDVLFGFELYEAGGAYAGRSRTLTEAESALAELMARHSRVAGFGIRRGSEARTGILEYTWTPRP